MKPKVTLSASDIDNTTEQSLFFRPNPAVSSILIDDKFTNPKVKIYSVLGQKVLDIRSKNNEVDISQLKQGCYIIQVSDDEYLYSARFVKK